MKIAFTTKGIEWNSVMDSRFGRTDFIVVYDMENKKLSHVDNRSNGETSHGAGPQTAQLIYNLKIDVLITGSAPGGNAATILTQSKVEIFTGANNKTIKEAFEAYKTGQLLKA